MKKTERKTWKVARLRLEQSDKRLRKLQDAANKGHEATETSFRQLGGKPKRARKGDLNQIAASIVEQTTREKNPAAVELGRLGGLKETYCFHRGDRSPQVVYMHSDAPSQPERPIIYPYSPQPQPQTINVNVQPPRTPTFGNPYGN